MTATARRVAPHAAGNSSRTYLYEWVAQAADSVPRGSLVLDAGAGEAPYREMWRHVEYETADFAQVNRPYTNLTYECDLSAVPVEANRYDLVLMSQVLEHIPEPAIVLGEMARIVKPGGHLWVSCPLFYAEHEQPYDFYRYTQFALRRLVENAGLEVEQIDWLEGFFGTMSYQAHIVASSLPRKPQHYGGGIKGVLFGGVSTVVVRPLAKTISLGLCQLDLRVKLVHDGLLPKNYTVVARKPL
jgi:SAM-dependent methyltransferase